MSSAPFDQENNKNIWSKLKSSTNNLQSQLNNLSVNHNDYNSHSSGTTGTRSNFKSKLNLRSGDSTKTNKVQYFVERDGDLLTSTVVHKSLVKYYKNIKKDHPENFEGYPNWLGYEDKEDEEELAGKLSKASNSNKANIESLNDSSEESSTTKSQSNGEKIYRPDTSASENLRSGYKPLSGRSMQRTSFNKHSHTPSGSSNGGEDVAKSSPQQTKPSLKASSSMRDRLKRR